MIISRRGILRSLLAAPAVIAASRLMPVKAIETLESIRVVKIVSRGSGYENGLEEYTSYFQWYRGLEPRFVDWRYAVKIANIEHARAV